MKKLSKNKSFSFIAGCLLFFQIESKGAETMLLLAFDAKAQPDHVTLSWTTATEVNNDHFTVERSSDGKFFIPVSHIQGSGNSSFVRDYTCTDVDPLEGISYYRLKQVCFDGSFNYSDLIPVLIKNREHFEILSASTTVQSSVNVLFTSPVNKDCLLQISDKDGMPVFNLPLHATKGVNNKDFFCYFLKTGIYNITLSDKKEVLAKKISVLRY